MKIEAYIKNHPLDLINKKVLFVGWTGSIGYEALKIIASFKADLYLASRNLEKAEKKINELKKEYDVNVESYHLDVSSLRSIDSFVSLIKEKNLHFDYVINNAGVYHLPDIKTDEGYDILFATNTLGHIYLLEKMIPLLKEGACIVSTGSMSYKFHKIDLNNIKLEGVKGKMKRYSLSKQELLNAFMALKEKNSHLNMNIVHPGIVPTELFEKSHSKAFMIFCFPLMKILFHSPRKASLTIIEAMKRETKRDEWIGPRGLFEAWGLPKILKAKKNILKNNECVYKSIHEEYKESL